MYEHNELYNIISGKTCTNTMSYIISSLAINKYFDILHVVTGIVQCELECYEQR